MPTDHKIPGNRQAEEFSKNTTEVFKNASKTVLDVTSKRISDLSDQLKASHEKIKETLEKTGEKAKEYVAFGQKSMDHCVKSGKEISESLQDMTKHMSLSYQDLAEDTMNMIKAMSSAKSPTQVINLHMEYTRKNLDRALHDAKYISEATLKLCESGLERIKL